MQVSVFISYNHDSEVHTRRVLSLADQLRLEGLDVRLDQYVAHPPEGWPHWAQKQVTECDFVLIICTKAYRSHYERPDTCDVNRAVAWEALVVDQLIYEAGARNEKLLPVLFEGATEADVPRVLRSFTAYRLPDQYEDLYRRLTGQPRVPAPPIGTVTPMPTVPRVERETLPSREPWTFVPLGPQMEDPPQVGHMLTVDDCILLHRSSNGNAGEGLIARWLREVRLDIEPSPRQARIETPVSEEVLKETIREADLDGMVEEHLGRRSMLSDNRRGRMGPRARDVYVAKVGLREIVFPNGFLDEPLTLRCRPVSQWMQRDFNRRVLLDLSSAPEPDTELVSLYADCLRRSVQLDSRAPRLVLPGPGSLYVEGCVTSCEDDILLLSKTVESGSTFAEVGRPWTCGFEIGIGWTELAASGHVALGEALQRGLCRELGVQQQEIDAVYWEGIALECHLNTALLCTVRTTLRGKEMMRRAEEAVHSPAVGRARRQLEICALDQLVPRVFGRSHDDEWHTTARMRVLLWLWRVIGPRQATQRLMAERDADTLPAPWR